MNVLVLAAHPDDETLGMGGTIARLAQEGHMIWVATISDGETSRGSSFSAVLVMQRFEQFKKATAILGAHPYLENAPFPDQQMDAYPILRLAETIQKIVDAVRPDIVYTHSCHDLNQDHVAVHRATLIATRPQPNCAVKKVYTYEVPSATEWGFGQWGSFAPNVFVDIINTMKTKIRALMCYADEIRAWPHPRSPEAIQAIAHRWGSVAGCEAAEAFELIRAVR